MEEPINITKDLKGIKVSDLKDKVFVVIEKWLIQIRENPDKFKEEFLSKDKNKYFNDLKDLVGEFKELEKDFKGIDVGIFLLNIVCSHTPEYNNKFFIDMHEDYLKLKEKVVREYNNNDK